MVTPADLIAQIEDIMYNYLKDADKALGVEQSAFLNGYYEGISDLKEAIDGAFYEYGEMVGHYTDQIIDDEIEEV